MATGLFGPSPEEVQAAQEAALIQRGDTLAGMSPFQRANSMLYQGAGGLARAGAGALGYEDKAVARARQIKQIIAKFDTTTPEGMMQAAAEFNRLGMTNEAQIAVSKAQEAAAKARAAQKDAADIELKKAQAARAMREPSFRDYEYEKLMEVANDPDLPQEMRDQAKARLEALNKKAEGRAGAGNAGTGQLMVTADGMVARIDKGTGKSTLVLGEDGQPIKAASASPALKAQLAQAGAGAKAVGEAAGKAQVAEVSAANTMDTVNRQLDELLAHPGLASAVGVGIPLAKKIPGSPEAGFAARLDQIKGGAFLQAFEMLKGGGQITETEGAKATAAMNRMDAATSEKEFRAAAEDYRMALKTGLEKLKKIGALSYTAPGAAQPAPMAAPTPAPQATNAPKFSGITSPAQVRAMFKAGRMTREQAKAILQDMDSQGVK